MEDRRQEIDRRRHELAQRRKEQDARRKALDDRKHLYEQEAQLEEEERLLYEEEERLLREHERLDHLEFGLDFDEHSDNPSVACGQSGSTDSRSARSGSSDRSLVNAVVIAIGLIVIICAAFSWFGPLQTAFAFAGVGCLVVAVWRAFNDNERSFESLRVFITGVAFFWIGAVLIGMAQAISGVRWIGFLGNGILIVSGIIVCIYGFAGAFADDRNGDAGDNEIPND